MHVFVIALIMVSDACNDKRQRQRQDEIVEENKAFRCHTFSSIIDFQLIDLLNISNVMQFYILMMKTNYFKLWPVEAHNITV